MLAVLRRDVMVGSRGLGRRECRLDTGSKIDLKNLRDSCSLRSDRLGIFAQCRAFVYGMSFVKLNAILSALLCIASIWSMCALVNRWCQTGAAYSRTGLITAM